MPGPRPSPRRPSVPVRAGVRRCTTDPGGINRVTADAGRGGPVPSDPMSAVVLALNGLLVDGTVATVELMLAGLLVADEPRLVLDVSRVTVCDTAGAQLLVGAADLARSRGGE